MEEYEKHKKAKKMYEKLFSDNEKKAEAFDKIAEKYYSCNFGTMSKSEMDLLMFSEYLDRLRDISGNNMNAYSDYELSKQLGITQSRVSSLKERKELIYPYEESNWIMSLCQITQYARYDNEMIVLPINDKNLYLEIKNAIEKKGGYVEVQLNSKVLKIMPEYYFQLLMEISDEVMDNNSKDILKERMIKEIKNRSGKNQKIIEEFEKKELSENIRELGWQTTKDILEDLVKKNYLDCAADVIGALMQVLKIIRQ